MRAAQDHDLTTSTNLRELTDDDVGEFLRQHHVAVVKAYTQWCTFCKALAPHYAALAEEYDGRIAFSKLDAEAQPRYAEQNDVQSFPTLHFYVGGERVGTSVGFVRPPELRRILDEVLERA